ncbi:MAG: amidase [Acidimicrobiales bacterium]
MTALPDAVEQARLVADGHASPRELVDDAIARCEALNPQLNAVIHARFESARSEADALTRALADGPGHTADGIATDAPLYGVPMVVKDLGCPMAGEPHHQGNAALAAVGFREDHDAYLYRRFRQLGMVAIGRTNVPEFGSTITTEPAVYGPTRNPWNLDHSTGGSSGGSAAAVAAGIVAVGHANDGGGSIRIPASECGLVGLKPSRGRVSQGPAIGEGWNGATADGVVTRSVRDTAVTLDAIAGYEPGDPTTPPPPARPYADEVGADPGTLRIGLAPTVAHGEIDPQCAAAVEAAGALCESLGHHVELAVPDALSDPDFGFHFGATVAVATAADLDAWATRIGRPIADDELEGDNRAMAHLGRQISGPDYVSTVAWLHRWQRRMLAWWADGFDVLVTPTLASPPPRIGWLRDPDHGSERLRSILLTTAQFNVSGQPAVSLPLGTSDTGLPIGVQFVGPAHGESLLIRLAAQLEAAAPWADRRPPVSA